MLRSYKLQRLKERYNNQRRSNEFECKITGVGAPEGYVGVMVLEIDTGNRHFNILFPEFLLDKHYIPKDERTLFRCNLSLNHLKRRKITKEELDELRRENYEKFPNLRRVCESK